MPPARTARLNVLVVDGHRTFAEALAVALGAERDLRSTVAATGPEAVRAAGEEAPDVVLMELDLPGLGGPEAIRAIRRARPQARVVILSANGDDLERAKALEAGAVGLLGKDRSLREVGEAIRKAAKGERLIDDEERLRLLRVLHRRRHQESTERQRAGRLTPRQSEILQMMADGMGPKEIARKLGMSPLTLRTHVQNVLMRLGVHSKVEAIAVAIRQGKVRRY